jgi:hypothetical protein
LSSRNKNTQTDQNYRANWTVLAPGLQRIRRYLSAIFGLGRLHGFEGGIENETSEKNGNGLGNAIEVAR